MPQILTATSLADIVAPGQTIFLPGSAGAPVAFVDCLLAAPERSRGINILTSFIPGINTMDLDKLDPSARVTSMFIQPAFSAAQRDGRFRVLPSSYAGFVRHIRDNVDIDLAVIQVSPPDANGRCSLGPAVEFLPEILKKTKKVLALINRSTFALPGSISLDYAGFDYVCEVDTPLPTYTTDTDDATNVIARHIADLVEDGSTLQVGLGKVPAALSSMLSDRRKLRLHSGMLSDGMLEMAAAGALDPDHIATTTVLVGSDAFYRDVQSYERLQLRGVEVTHGPLVLGALERLVAVNSALEVDLFGQCNLEHADGRAVSGAGGAPDFARAARLSVGGKSIVALNGTLKAGKASRIVASLSAQAVSSLPRVDIDYVITEFGVAKLNGASVHERAEALINVAAPQFREGLLSEWKAIAARL